MKKLGTSASMIICSDTKAEGSTLKFYLILSSYILFFLLS